MQHQCSACKSEHVPPPLENPSKAPFALQINSCLAGACPFLCTQCSRQGFLQATDMALSTLPLDSDLSPPEALLCPYPSSTTLWISCYCHLLCLPLVSRVLAVYTEWMNLGWGEAGWIPYKVEEEGL